MGRLIPSYWNRFRALIAENLPLVLKIQGYLLVFLCFSLPVLFLSGIILGKHPPFNQVTLDQNVMWLVIAITILSILIYLVGSFYLRGVAVANTSILEERIDQHQATARDLNQSLAHTMLLNRVIAATTSTHNTEEILNMLCQEVAVEFHLPQAAFALLNETKTELKVVAEYREGDRPSAIGEIIPVAGNPPTQYVLEKHLPFVVEDLQNDPSQAIVQDISARRGTVTLLIVPLVIQGRVLGTLGLDSLEKRTFTEEEISLAKSIASSVGQSLENARLYTLIQQELLERKRIEDRLRYEALHDPLTGLPNRLYFMDQVRRTIERTLRKDSIAALIFMDLDRFKLVNDSLGHDSGDKMLMIIARRLEESVRPGDVVARFGGDEFAVLLEDVKTSQDACGVCDRIHKNLALPAIIMGHEFSMTASMGITFTGDGYRLAEDMLRDADIAMYRAKGSGKARYEIFRSDMHREAVADLRLVDDLRRGLEMEEFVLHFQPVVSLKTGKITALEALLRWEHPLRGLLLPDSFLPLADETGLIVQLSEWAIRSACHQIHEWELAGYTDLVVDINLAVARQSEEASVQSVSHLLANVGACSRSVQVEISESIAIENLERAERLIRQLKDNGINVTLDSFGSHYSNITSLIRFPVDAIKIDRRLVRSISTNDGDAVITSTLIRLGHSRGLKIVAVGVETQDQLEYMLTNECDLVQGNLISPPVPAHEVTKLLRAGEMLLSRGSTTQDLPQPV